MLSNLVDMEGLLESLSAAVAHPSLPAVEQDIALLVGDEDTEARQMRAVAVTVLALLDSLGEVAVSTFLVVAYAEGSFGGSNSPIK